MNKVIIINLNGTAYQLEESGFDALRAYLDTAAGRLGGNPDRDEIIADIEQAIAEKFRALLGVNKSVVLTREVEAVIAEMGPVEDASGGAAAGEAAGPKAGQEAPSPGGPHGAPKRLYKVDEGAMLCGVCNGLAAYLGMDVTVVRILFAVLTLVYGMGVLVYIVMVLLVPSATTSAEKAAASGSPSTAQEFIRRARQGYYEGMKTFGDRRAHREWRRRFRQEMRGWKQDVKRDLRQNAHRWAFNWHAHWNQNPHPDFGGWILIPFLSLLAAALTIVGIFSILSLLATGTILGIGLPSGIPTWAGIVLLIFFFNFITWPLKVMRRSMYYGAYPPYCAAPFVHLWNVFIGIAAVCMIVWLARHHSGELRDAVVNLPQVFHQAVHDIKQWWERQ